MKFGHTLRTSLNPDWTFHYVGKNLILYMFVRKSETNPTKTN